MVAGTEWRAVGQVGSEWRALVVAVAMEKAEWRAVRVTV